MGINLEKNVEPFSKGVRLDDSADWTLRLHLAFLLPKSIFSN